MQLLNLSFNAHQYSATHGYEQGNVQRINDEPVNLQYLTMLCVTLPLIIGCFSLNGDVTSVVL
jgi:hypothetical protein